MIERAFVLLVALSTCVLSLPVTSSELENGDVKVMKCIVEALADVLSMPHPVPVSQECLDILRTDDRLFSILRHHNFLKEMQGIAVSGASKRVQLHSDIMVADHVTKIPPGTEDSADQSMLEALGGPGEHSILAQKRRRAGEGDHKKEEEEEEEEKEEEKRAQESHESQEHNETGGKGKEKEKEEEEVQRKSRGEKDDSDERISSWMADRPEKGKQQEEFGGGAGGEDEVHEEKRSHTEDRSQEGLGVRHVTKEKKDDDSNVTRNTHDAKSEERKKKAYEEEEDEDEDALNRTRSTLLPHGAMATEEEEEDMKRGNDFARWSRQVKRLPMRKNVSEKEEQEETSSSQQEVAHHSREAAMGGEEEEREEEEQGEEVKRAELQRSREEKELRNIALQRAPEEKRGLEEEGSAIRKSEEPEIASLAAIESELENVAQKLHQLRRG